MSEPTVQTAAAGGFVLRHGPRMAVMWQVLAAAGACASSPAPLPASLPESSAGGVPDQDAAPPSADRDEPKAVLPTAPTGDAPGFSVVVDRHWLLVGDGLSPAQDLVTVEVLAPPEVLHVDLWVNDRWVARAERQPGSFQLEVDAASLPVGEHQILLNANDHSVAFAQRELVRSHPYYVFVSNDWDDADQDFQALRRAEQLHDRHPELVMTHFVGPYLFTHPQLLARRREQLIAWLELMRDGHNDEIGLHIHPYCHFVSAARLPCRSQPAYDGSPSGDASGYSVYLSAYPEDETLQLLRAADQLFQQHGFDKPTSFRAGGWTAESHTLRALARAGYVADSSAANWQRLEEWEGTSFFAWLREHWTNIDERTQPYYPAENNIQGPGDPSVPLLEVPDNGALVDYVTHEEMIEMFRVNWDGKALDHPVAYSIGFHPDSFSQVFFQELDLALSHIDQFLASRDLGPVVFAQVSQAPLVWSRP